MTHAPTTHATFRDTGFGLPSAGDFCYDDASDSVFEVLSIGLDGDLSRAALRYLGGAGNTTDFQWHSIVSFPYRFLLEDWSPFFP